MQSSFSVQQQKTVQRYKIRMQEEQNKRKQAEEQFQSLLQEVRQLFLALYLILFLLHQVSKTSGDLASLKRKYDRR